MSEENNINELSARKAAKLAEIFAKHYVGMTSGADVGFDQFLVELGRRGEELLLLQNDVVVCMCAWYYWGEQREDVRGEFGVEGDVKSAFAQFEQHLRAFEMAVKTAEEASRG